MPRRAGIAALLLALSAGLLPSGMPGATIVAAAEPTPARERAVGPGGIAHLPQVPPPPGARGTRPGAATCEHADGQVIVKFKPHAKASAHAAAYKAVKGKPVKKLRTVPGLEIVETRLTPERAGRALKDDPAVEYVEPDCVVKLDATPNDPDLGDLWGLANTGQAGGTPRADIGAAEAWDVRTDASAVTVAVIDTGIQRNHPDLLANGWTNTDEIAGNGIDDDHNGYVDDRIGWDWVNGDANPDDDYFHGTHVAGTIGARGNNAVGVTGVAWQVKLMALKAFDSNGSAQTSTIISAIDYAAANGATVINASFGSTEFSRAMYDAFEAAGQAGVLTVAAAGNDGKNADASPGYPGAFRLDTLISVAATTRFDELASFSNYGIHNVLVAAPGESILSTVLGNGYGTASGTSMATPHVTGVAALLAAQHPTWTPKQLRDRILGTVRAVPALDGKAWTGGVVDAGAALGNGPTVLPPDPPAPTPVALAPTTLADPAPTPATAPAPPDYPDPDVVDSSPADLSAPEIAFDSTGVPYVAYVRRFDGVHLASRPGSDWTDKQLTTAYDDIYHLDLAVGGDDIPQVAVQRVWGDLATYSDPGIVVARSESGDPDVQRVTAACPQADSCFWDWNPATAADASGALHVAFTRTAAWDQDMVKAPAGSSSPVPGNGLYYATDEGGTWTVRQLIDGGNGGVPAIAVEGDGTVHIVVSLVDGSDSGLYYATNEGGTWSLLRLTTDVTDTSASVAVDASGGVHVAWARFGLGVWYRHRAPAGTWDAEVRLVDDAAYQVGLAVDGGGHVHAVIGRMDATNTVNGIMYATNASGPWVATPVGGSVAAYPSIAVDGDGTVGIAYLDYTDPPIGIAVALKVGSTFQYSRVREFSDTAGAPLPLAHAVDANGHSHVVVGRGWGSSDPGVWYATDASGTWQLEKIAHGYPNAVAIAVDQLGRPHVAFEQTPQDQVGPPVTQRVGYAVRTNGSWTIQSITGADYGEGVAIALDAAGTPNVLWPNSGGTALLRGRPSGGGWTIDTAYGGPGFFVRQPAAVFDPTNVLHVTFDASFSGVDGSRLMYAKRTASAWSNATVAGGGVYHFYPSIARTASGALWIADWRAGQDTANDGVWAYTSNGGAWTATNLGNSAADAYASVAVDAAGRVRVAWSRTWYYSSSGCSVPMCLAGPGLRESVLDGGSWTTTKLSAYWHDLFAKTASGPDGAIRIVWERLEIGLRALTTVAGVDTIAPAATITPSKTATNAATVDYAVQFSEPVTGLTATDFSLTGTAAGCVIDAPTGSGTSWAVGVSGCGEGTLSLRLAAGSVLDGASNAGPSGLVNAATVTIDRTAPSVTAPTLTPRLNASLSGTAIPITVSWTGADAGSGVATYTLERSTNGGGTWSVVASGLTGTSRDTTMASSGTDRFRVRAIDKAGNISTNATAATLTGRLVQQGSSAVTYKGTWRKATSGVYSGGSSRYTRVANRSAKYTFTGRSIALISSRASNRGKVRIFINGVDQGVVNLYRSSTQHRAVVWQRTWSATVTVTIRVVALGQPSARPRVDVDAFVRIQ